MINNPMFKTQTHSTNTLYNLDHNIAIYRIALGKKTTQVILTNKYLKSSLPLRTMRKLTRFVPE